MQEKLEKVFCRRHTSTESTSYQTKDCSSKFRSKHSSNTVLCLLRNLFEQSLVDKDILLNGGLSPCLNVLN